MLFLGFGLFYTTTAGPLDSMIAELVSDHNAFGAASGLRNTLGPIGSTIGVFIFGLLLDITGSYAYPWITLGAVALTLSLPLLFLTLKGY